jgi:hypothetical protein
MEYTGKCPYDGCDCDDCPRLMDDCDGSDEWQERQED